eukprot:CAMPEP_0118866924 /NCGR_PEP_ID=MMETSP1163-20130328/10692_1 /TAXON_ID=124430 /ORGANISM="Phaeomonas parva, Strain CCMP2877" /LENGTH=136 /DNA_ID=CAMNT_0006801289 /DNA_START=138 /DNA_END=547 /DNA_ORIENTATION=-
MSHVEFTSRAADDGVLLSRFRASEPPPIGYGPPKQQQIKQEIFWARRRARGSALIARARARARMRVRRMRVRRTSYDVVARECLSSVELSVRVVRSARATRDRTRPPPRRLFDKTSQKALDRATAVMAQARGGGAK